MMTRMPPSRHRSWNEVTGLLLFFGGVLLFLSLCSFDSKDVPSWMFFANSGHASEIPANFVGRFGAIVAGLMYFLFGGASYFAAMALLGLGLAKFTGQDDKLWIRFGWAFVFVLSWCFLLDLQHVILVGWKQ